MKTPRFGSRNRLLTIAAAVSAIVSGCGAPIDATDKEGASGTSSNNPPAAAVAAAEANDTNELAVGTIIKRSERPAPPLPEDVQKVVQLVESGAGDEVVRAYVGSSSERFELSLEQIIYLRDIGISDGIIAAMMRRGSELRDKDTEAVAQQTNLVAAVETLKDSLKANAESQPAAFPAEVQAIQSGPAPAEAPAEVQPYYSSLAPYGSWYQVPAYGWVWQPSCVAVDPGWTPYQQGGHWLWTDCGWYWQSDYSWGWAPFHYGRWCTYPGVGWCWAPGTVWGPSWVTWRHCDGYLGWAPLPPACGWSAGVGLTWYGHGVSVGFGFGLASSCYTFVPYNQFCHRNVHEHAVHGDAHHNAYQNSTVVNNVIHGDNNVIVNNGVGYSQVASRVRGEVPKARVETLPTTAASQTLRADRTERTRDGFVVYRPAPVESAGGRPTALRTEVRPAASPVAGSRSEPAGTRGVPSRYATGGVPPGKSVETRGSVAGSVSHATVPTAPSGSYGARSAPNARVSTVPNSRAGTRPPTGSAAPKLVETRGSDLDRVGVNGANSASPQPNASVGAPRRQTLPVPLADPSKNIPNYSAPSKAPETRYSPGAAPRTGSTVAPQAPVYAPSAPLYRGSSPSVNAPGGYSRPAYSAPAPSMNVPRPSYSSPAPSMNVPRPSYSTPGPSVGPSPSSSAPRPSVSAPAPATAAPSAGYSPRGGGTGNRSQPN